MFLKVNLDYPINHLKNVRVGMKTSKLAFFPKKGCNQNNFYLRISNSCFLNKICPITVRDRRILNSFYKLYRNESINYQDNWDYIIQACRGFGGLGGRLLSTDSFIPIGIHNDHFVIVNPVGKNLFKSIPEIASFLALNSSLLVYLKHIERECFETLVNVQGFHNIESYPWDCDEIKDDDTYPQLLVNIEKFLSDWNTYTDLRLRINRFNNLLKERNLTYSFEEIDLYPYEHEVIKFFKSYSRNYEAYENMIKVSSLTRLNYVLKINNLIAAVFFIGRIGKDAAGCYANICKYDDFPALQEFAILKLLEKLAYKDIRFFNFGGSETQSLSKFKEKFRPTKRIISNYLVYKG